MVVTDPILRPDALKRARRKGLQGGRRIWTTARAGDWRGPLTLIRVPERRHGTLKEPFRELLRSLGGLDGLDQHGGDLEQVAAEGHDVGLGVAAETVRAVRDAGHFTRGPETRDDLAFGRQGLGLFVDAHAAHRVVGGRDGLDDVVLALLHVDETGAVVEVLVIALAGHVGDALDGLPELVERDLREVGDALQVVAGRHDALLREGFVLVGVSLDRIGDAADLVVPEHPAVAAGLVEDGFGEHVAALEFLDEFKLNLFAKEIRVFTPKGYMRTLPKGATALDFAYDIHTEIGNTCIGAKVNHKLVPMSHKLTSGDQVEILTSDKQKPQREWLDFVVTAKARTHINATFKKYRKEQIRTGITIFEAVVKKLDLPPTSEPLKKVLTDYNLTNKDDLYVELAKNIITEGDLEKVLKKKAENKFIKYWKLQFLWNGKDGEEKKKNDNDVQLDVNSDFVIAPCCNPIPGDDVVGMNIAGTKVTVHKRSCPEAIRLMASFGDKIVPIKWVSHKLMSFLTVIKMTGIDKPGIVSDITALIAKEGKVNMRMIHFDTRDGIFEGFIHLYVHNTADLNNIVSRISQIQGVESVMRVENEER